MESADYRPAGGGRGGVWENRRGPGARRSPLRMPVAAAQPRVHRRERAYARRRHGGDDRGPGAPRRGAAAAAPAGGSGSDRHAAEALRGWRIPRVRVPGVRADSRGIRGAVRGRGRKRSPWCARDHAGRRPHGFRRLRDGAVLRRGGGAAGPRPRLRDVGAPARCGPGRGPDRRFLAFAARRGPERARRPRTGRRPRRDRGGRPAQGVSRPGSDSPGRPLPAAAHGASGPAAVELPCRYRHHDRRPGVLARGVDLHHREAETGSERRPRRSGAHRAGRAALRGRGVRSGDARADRRRRPCRSGPGRRRNASSACSSPWSVWCSSWGARIWPG